jgi:hypothetical protein
VNAASTVQNIGTVTKIEAATPTTNVSQTQSQKAQIHHIATNKNKVRPKGGGPWTPIFEEMFDKAGMSMNHQLNKVSVIGHSANHPAEYHLGVWKSQNEAVEGLEGSAYTKAFQSELVNLRNEISTSGTRMNELVTKNEISQGSRSKIGKSNRSPSKNKGSSVSQERKNDNRRKH